MNQLFKLTACICLIVFSSCKIPRSSSSPEPLPKQLDPSNVLDVIGSPKHPTDRSVFAFSDLGAWFGFALPDQPKHAGSFSGPFLMTQDNGIWSSDCLAKMEIFNPETGENYSLEAAKKWKRTYLPGKLVQEFELEKPGISVQSELIFANSRTALIHMHIRALSDSVSLPLGLRWQGNSFVEGLTFGKTEKGIRLNFQGKETIGEFAWSEGYPVLSYASKERYYISFEQEDIATAAGWSLAFTQSLYFDRDELYKGKQAVNDMLANPRQQFIFNNERWQKMLQDVITEKIDFDNQRLAIKCLETLVSNWRSPAGFIEHGGLFPTYNYKWFHGFWAWDSWKHAAALARFQPELAKDQIRAMFDFQNERGMIVDCYYRDTLIENHNWRNTKPPLAAWAAWNVFEQSRDTAFLREMYPLLAKYHQWWYTDRDHNQNGLCEYGSTDGTLKAAKWESGMDNAIRFDDASILQNNEYAWSMNQESVDLNAYLYVDKNFLISICDVIGKSEASKRYEEEGQKLYEMIKEVFFDEETGWYYDVRLEDQSFVKVMGAEGWIPLWAEIATPEQAKAMHKVLTDTNKFATYIPFPTVAADHPKFSPEDGYWRGPVWLDQAYFAIEGIRKYGYREDASRFSQQLYDRLEGVKEGQTPIRENYHPLTGEGLESSHFSWSAAHLLLLLWEQD
jgi:putative isomerase